jgi:peptide methionine sulfoxide reductase MsrA
MYSGALSGCVWCTHEYSQAVCGVLRSTLRLCVVYSGVLSGCVWYTQEYSQAVCGVLRTTIRLSRYSGVLSGPVYMKTFSDENGTVSLRLYLPFTVKKDGGLKMHFIDLNVLVCF